MNPHPACESNALSRRRFLQTAAVSVPGLSLAASGLHAAFPPEKRPKVGVVFTACFHRSHAHVILENFLQPYLFNGKKTDPGVEVVSLYGDQFPSSDISREIARRFDLPIFKTIDRALCLGGKELAVDAVLSIGEHGDYPVSDLGQRMYPRKRLFDEEVAVMKRSGRFVPLFNDKHLSYRWDWAKEMYDTAREHGIPFMAGSSVPLGQRTPPLELPPEAEIDEAVSIHGGGVESYDFHALEVLQSLIESRKGGETGVSSVEFLDREALLKAFDDGRISQSLVEAAMEAEFTHNPIGSDRFDVTETPNLHGVLLRYRDGTRGAAVKVGNSGVRWNFACRLKGDPEIKATSIYVGPWNNRNLFKALSHAIQTHFIHREAPYPVERTLLVSGILVAEMQSRQQNKPLATPHLEFAYAPRDFRPMREMGATWKIITEDTPEPEGVVPHGL